MNPEMLLLLPVVPALTALFLALAGRRLAPAVVGGIACAGVAVSFAVGVVCVVGLDTQRPTVFDAGPWLRTAGFTARFALRLDSVAGAMVLLVSGFGALITLYSVGYMRGAAGVARFFASLNLFVASMLALVLADNLLLIFLGWEGVGLCSYLLIGHDWQEAHVPRAAYRAFFTNRVGDLLFILGVACLYEAFGSFALVDLAAQANQLSPEALGLARWGALFLLGGVFAKSAQVPLHIWLPDAMAGPTPVSALIHAATMVTAGVYLVARLEPLYRLFPAVLGLIFVCALATLALGAVLAIVQTDIKKILAYSTLSNLGLMFLALAAGAPGAARMHLFGHACFKALLFLAAGSVIVACHHEQNVSRLAGCLRRLPVTRAAFWVGSLGGTGLLPFVSAGFFSKELVLEAVGQGTFTVGGLALSGGLVAWVVTVIEWLSVVYTFRLLGLLEAKVPGPAVSDHGAHAHGAHGTHAPAETSTPIRAVLLVLCVVGTVFGVLSAPAHWGGLGVSLYRFVSATTETPEGPTILHALLVLAPSLLLALLTFRHFSSPRRASKTTGAEPSPGKQGPLARLFYFDEVYETFIFSPLRALARLFAGVGEDVARGVPQLTGASCELLSSGMRRLVTGKIHHYAAWLLAAALVLLLLVGR
ncbi:MAG: NADH-quinone oxidoreductase subunit L [Myxococcales bacterium]|nr:NADH-quinone oxidoreductase subunit L [Myxococcales bacterium]